MAPSILLLELNMTQTSGYRANLYTLPQSSEDRPMSMKADISICYVEFTLSMYNVDQILDSAFNIIL